MEALDQQGSSMATTTQTLELVRRTAWMNIQIETNPAFRKSKPTDRDELVTAMYMLAYIGAINMALYDLIDELTDTGLYRHAIKRDVNRALKIVGNANNLASSILKAVNGGKRVRQHSDMWEYAYNKVQDHIKLEPPLRAYNIVRALTRLFTDAYNEVGRKTSHLYLREASDVLQRLVIPSLKEYPIIDTIIKNAVQIELINGQALED